MLREISIRQFAIIEELHLQFAEGFHVLTGETGAGKSILLDALGLIVGGRASVEYVRHRAEKAEIEALFECSLDPSIRSLLEEWGMETEEDQLMIRREIMAGGKSTCRINGRIVTVSMLKQLGSHLIDLHGQHEHQSLLKVEEHLEWLDHFSGKSTLQKREQYKKEFLHYQRLDQELSRLDADQKEIARRIDLLHFQEEEIAAAQLTVGEEEALEAEQRLLTHGERLQHQVHLAYHSLYGEDRSVDQVQQALLNLEEALSIDESLQPIHEMVQTAAVHLEEAVRQIGSYQDGLEFDPIRLEEVQERLYLIRGLKRKYGTSIPEILQVHEQIKYELDTLTHRDERCEELQNELKQVGGRLEQLANELTVARKSAASRLETLVEQELSDLQMGATVFHVAFFPNRKRTFTQTGKDQIEFQIAPNLGEPLRPLAKIASGGELSRIMLALRSIFSHVDRIHTLVFDEIDTGVSGRAAQAIAEKITALAQKHQILCVTHLPQVACMADHHFSITKHSMENKTQTKVRKLNRQEKIFELARMLGGVEVTETTKKHAQEMIRLADQVKTGM